MKSISVVTTFTLLLLIEPTVGFMCIVRNTCTSLPVITTTTSRFPAFGFLKVDYTTTTTTTTTRRYNNNVENSKQQQQENEASSIIKENEYGDDGGFDLDDIASMKELRQLSSDVGGPEFGEEMSLEKARDILWTYVEETAEDDIDDMCMGQLGGLMVSFNKGVEIPDEFDIEQARNFVWEFIVKDVACSVNELGYNTSNNCECFSCSNIIM